MFISHWNCSKLADKIRGTEKPQYATMDEWAVWHTEARKNHPFRYWVGEDFLHYAQYVVQYLPNKIKSLAYYIKMSFTDRRDILASNGMLVRGNWYDLDTTLEVCIFESFRNFFEKELIPSVTMEDSRPIKEILTEFDLATDNNKKYTELYRVYIWWQQNKNEYFSVGLPPEEIEANLISIIKYRSSLWT